MDEFQEYQEEFFQEYYSFVKINIIRLDGMYKCLIDELGPENAATFNEFCMYCYMEPEVKEEVEFVSELN